MNTANLPAKTASLVQQMEPQ